MPFERKRAPLKFIWQYEREREGAKMRCSRNATGRKGGTQPEPKILLYRYKHVRKNQVRRMRPRTLCNNTAAMHEVGNRTQTPTTIVQMKLTM